MTPLFSFLILFAAAMITAYNWVKGIEHMKNNHPDYKGEDFLGEDVDTK
jgi:uncharacterized short protein YbdD (DUF466 family)